jgi:hypothetical protein
MNRGLTVVDRYHKESFHLLQSQPSCPQRARIIATSWCIQGASPRMVCGMGIIFALLWINQSILASSFLPRSRWYYGWIHHQKRWALLVPKASRKRLLHICGLTLNSPLEVAKRRFWLSKKRMLTLFCRLGTLPSTTRSSWNHSSIVFWSTTSVRSLTM